MSDARDDPDYPYDREQEQQNARKADTGKPGRDAVERASCQHMVQSNGTCGMGGCDNYGKF